MPSITSQHNNDKNIYVFAYCREFKIVVIIVRRKIVVTIDVLAIYTLMIDDKTWQTHVSAISCLIRLSALYVQIRARMLTPFADMSTTFDLSEVKDSQSVLLITALIDELCSDLDL
ncbi:hypothetical protein GJ496_007371 [Pomphorhynchus laevis]|nr:hypothetical protein GJ496_007371 [Pomphorhynchus laevis]